VAVDHKWQHKGLSAVLEAGVAVDHKWQQKGLSATEEEGEGEDMNEVRSEARCRPLVLMDAGRAER
jgi:hypothetical protein